MEEFWNRVQWQIFRFEKIGYKIVTYPIDFLGNIIYNIKFIKNRLKKFGFTPKEALNYVDKINNDPEIGVNSVLAGIHMGGLLIMVEYTFFNLLQAILKKPIFIYMLKDQFSLLIFIAVLVAVSGLINYSLLWKDDKYVRYFKEFEKESKQLTNKWAWISLGVIVVVIFLFILSFFILAKANVMNKY